MPSRAQALRRHSEHYLSVLRSVNKLYGKGGKALGRGIAVFDLESANIQSGFAYSEKYSKSDTDAAWLCNAYPIAGFFVLNLRLSPRERLRWFNAGYGAARRLKVRSAQGTHLGNIALAFINLGKDHEALRYSKKFLDIGRSTGDSQSQTIALGILGLAYLNLGDKKRATESFEEELVLARKTKNRRAEGNALNHLGLIYANSDNHYRAIETWKKSLTLAREIGDIHDQGTDLGNLAISYEKVGKQERALALYRQHIRIARKLGDESGEARSLWNASRLLASLGRYATAISYAEQILNMTSLIGEGWGLDASSIRNHIAYWRNGSSPPNVTLWNGSF